ncbi:MAG: hypothetical protein AVDCRST_MAG40-3270 [uncultured Gemmatimonadaceae bacterium]|uniref:Uncharacterized protein n=1 Tax=uncultured Gemmatimonadaceae bacterium TaxID=246130 RepID=A0A6J4MEU2_9BACT|nr:MAG: hypothetical protein AVDCRST_MAG40-3270 [uncultured Gemmatimonadaceae bacterium]
MQGSPPDAAVVRGRERHAEPKGGDAAGWAAHEVPRGASAERRPNVTPRVATHP